ncbi:MAG: hypothetical protein R8G66_13855 [Cytophagales bacterium]|nr:hypothetical protein [Cytophagales bacterium]
MKHNKFKQSIAFLLLSGLLASCASSYRNINPNGLNYNGSHEHNGVTFQYKYDVLRESGNKKYAKRETKKEVQLIGLSITNNSDQPLTLAKDVNIIANNEVVLPLDPKSTQSFLKQNVPIYLLYFLLSFNTQSCENGDCETTIYPIGIPIAAGNMIMAGSANSKFLNELETKDILNKTVQRGETVYGLVGLRSTQYAPLTFEIR